MAHLETPQGLTAGALAVTVNRRLARTMIKSFDAKQLSQGKRAWPSAQVLPWESWLRTLYRQLREGDEKPSQLLSDVQAGVVWNAVITRSGAGSGLLDTGAAAVLARKAFALQHSWRVDCSGAVSPDQLAYLVWSRDYRSECRRHQWLDAAELVDWLNARADQVAELLRRDFAGQLSVVGFDTLTAAQNDFLDSLRRHGIDVIEDDLPGIDSADARLLSCEDDARELLAAANWARDQLQSRAAGTIGIVVPDLAQRRDALVQVLNETLNPDSALQPQSTTSPHYNISLGTPLAICPMVADALGWLHLLNRSQPLAQCTRLLLSPFIGDALAERSVRALADAGLRRGGRGEYSIHSLTAALRAVKKPPRMLIERLDRLNYLIDSLPVRQSHARWSQTFSDLLDILGWPGEGTLNSEEYQLHQVWRDVMLSLSEFDLMGIECRFHESLARLRESLGEEVFQVETVSDARLQVVGLLEVTGMHFDALWVMSADENSWPARAQLNPFLPIAAQRSAGVPHSSPAWEDGFARRTLNRLYAGADTLVFSYARRNGDADVAPSPLIAALPHYIANPAVWVDSPVRQMRQMPVHMECEDDSHAPPWPGGTVIHGGVDVLSDQAECPFRAFARHRLQADSLDDAQTGVSAAERGSLLHAAMEQIWATLQTQSALLAMNADQLRSLIETAVDRAITARRSVAGSAFLALERTHLIDLIGSWLALEKDREPFAIDSLEQPHEITVGDLPLRLRIDRSDTLANGARVLIDYKTGKPPVDPKSGKARSGDWNKPRPHDVQLPLYLLADPQPVDAVTLAYVRTHLSQFKGVGDDSVSISGIDSVGRNFKQVQCEDWQAVQEFWQRELVALADEFSSGVAGVTPRKPPQTCQFCPLDPLCRVGSSGSGDNDHE